MSVLVQPGTELVIVAAGEDYLLAVSSICARVADYVRLASVPLAIRSCDLRYDWSPGGILTNGYTGTWIVALTTGQATTDAAKDMLAGALRVATGYYPAEIGVARVGGVPTDETVPADPDASFLGSLGATLTMIANSLPWVLVILLVLAVWVIVVSVQSGGLRLSLT